MIRARHRSPLLAALTVALTALSACGDTPTQITPLSRAVGEVQGVLLQVDNLLPLVDPATEGIYTVWALLERNQSERLGTFEIDESGRIVDENGTPITQFTSDAFAVRRTLRLLITIETGSESESPSGMQILTGTFVEGVANLEVPISTAIRSAAGSLRVFTPTNGPGTNESSGFWMIDAAGEPTLDIPDSTGALTYEGFVEIGDRLLNFGRFEVADRKDDNNRFSSDAVAPPDVPGEDFLRNAPEGLVFPVDLSGARVTISLEGRANDFIVRSQLIVLEAVLPGGLRGGELVPFVNRTAETFPSGKAVLF